LVCKVLGTIHANNKSDEVRAHHHQNIEDSTNSTAVAIPPLFAELRTENREYRKQVRNGLALNAQSIEEITVHAPLMEGAPSLPLPPGG
jgi:hypothetical protein